MIKPLVTLRLETALPKMRAAFQARNLQMFNSDRRRPLLILRPVHRRLGDR